MAPLPKRKHSKMRRGKRMNSRKTNLPKLVVCQNCKKLKLPHKVCKNCGK